MASHPQTQIQLRRRQLLAAVGVAACGTLETPKRTGVVSRAAPASATHAEREPHPPVRAPHAESNADSRSATTRADTARESFPLFERYPLLKPHLPRVLLGDWPTPLLSVPSLAAELGFASLHIKRDDLSAKPYGGGKPRKLELFLGKAVEAGLDGVVTSGGVGSHHAVATAIYAKQLGLSCRLMLLPQPPTDEVRRVLLTCQAVGAKMQLVSSNASALRRAEKLGPGWLIIAPGGSSPLGNIGFIHAALELAAQLEANTIPIPDTTYLPVGTMGSAVGLAIGFALANIPSRIVGVRASSWKAASLRKLEALHAETTTWLRKLDSSIPPIALPQKRFRFENRFLGRGYAQPTPAGRAAAARVCDLGLRLDPTYSAKALAALIANAPAHQGEHVLFWHTHSHQRLTPVGSADALPKSLRSYAMHQDHPGTS